MYNTLLYFCYDFPDTPCLMSESKKDDKIAQEKGKNLMILMKSLFCSMKTSMYFLE